VPPILRSHVGIGGLLALSVHFRLTDQRIREEWHS